MRSVALRPLPPRLGNQVQGLVVFGQFAGNAVNPFGAELQHSVTGRNMLGRSSFPLRVRLPGQKSQKETQLRNLLLGGTVGVAFTLGAAGMAYANNPNVPTWSPLSINTNIGHPIYRYHTYRTREHRAAYVAPTPPDRPIFDNGSAEDEHMLTPGGSDHSADSPGVKNEAPMADQ